MALQSGGEKGSGELKPGSVLQQRYRIVEKTSEGRNFRAYLAEDLNTSATVTVKALRYTMAEEEKAIQQFRAEYESLRQLRHPALPRLESLFEFKGDYFMILERVDAQSLQDVIEGAGKPADMSRVLVWMWELLDAMDYLHHRDPPIIHRDLQPSTILITREGHLQLMDFGIAKIAEKRDSRTLYGSAGNTGYAPTEQFSLKRSDPRIDIFSAGASFYFALSGQHPPPASERVLKNLPLLDLWAVNNSVPEKISKLIHQMMSIKSSDRPRDCDAVRALIGVAPPNAVVMGRLTEPVEGAPEGRPGENEAPPPGEAAPAPAPEPMPATPPTPPMQPEPAPAPTPPPLAPAPPAPPPPPPARVPSRPSAPSRVVATAVSVGPSRSPGASLRRAGVIALVVLLLSVGGMVLSKADVDSQVSPSLVHHLAGKGEWLAAWTAADKAADAGDADGAEARGALTRLFAMVGLAAVSLTACCGLWGMLLFGSRPEPDEGDF